MASTTDLAAVALIRAAVTGDSQSATLILSQHGGVFDDAVPEGELTHLAVSLMHLAARTVESANGFHARSVLNMLDAWAQEYSDALREAG